MAVTVASLQNSILVEGEEDKTDESDKSNANENEKSQSKEVNDVKIEVLEDLSSSAHTDSENNEGDEEISKRNKLLRRPSDKNFDNQNSVNVHEGNEMELVECYENTNLLQVPPRNDPATPPPPLPLVTDENENLPRKQKKFVPTPCLQYLSRISTEEEAFINEVKKGNRQESYPAIKMRRKNLLKIERLTDSDSRSPNEMKNMCLSPPSSSDDENMYIGWVAYPSTLPRPLIQKKRSRRRRHRQKVLCACVAALKCLISPVAKMCKICRNRSNKVKDEGTLKKDNYSDDSDSSIPEDMNMKAF